MIFIAFALVLLGLFTAVLGLKLFRVILPLAGLFAGVMVGFGGVQGVFGTGAISTSIAVMMALIVGVLMSLLSFVFLELAVYVLSAMVGAAALSYLGVVLTLGDNGLLMLLLAIAGAIIGFIFASHRPALSTSVVVAMTSFAGVSFVLAGVMLLVGDVSLDQLHDGGVIASVLDVVDNSFIWLLVWIGASVLALNTQLRLLMTEVIGNNYAFIEKKVKKGVTTMAKKNNTRITGVKSSSIAMFEGVFGSIIGLGIAIMYSLNTTVEYTEATDSVFAGLALGATAGIVSIIVLPFVYFALGWVTGYIHGFMFNVLAENSEGIVIRTEIEK